MERERKAREIERKRESDGAEKEKGEREDSVDK